MVQQQRLTVVQVLPSLESGGVERGTLEVAAELVRRGHRSIVISAGGRLVDELETSGSQHVCWPIGKKSITTLGHVPKLRRLLQEQQVDILHARSRLPAWIAWLAWRGMPVQQRPRFVTTVHGQYSVSRYSAIMLRGERVIAVSDTIRQYIVNNYPRTDAAKITVIPRGIDPQAFPHGYCPDEVWIQAWRAQFPQLEHKKILTLPGRITRLKGHEDFIQLIRQLKENGVTVHGLIVGEEDPGRLEYAQQLRNQIHALGLDADITFTGYRADMKQIYALSDVVLSLSTKPESFGRTVLEALSIGTPVAGYDHGGVGEILRDLFPQGRVQNGDVQVLQQKVTELINSPPAVRHNTRFTLQSMLDSTVGLYIEMQHG